MPLPPGIAHNFPHPGVYFSSDFSYSDKYETFPVRPPNITHWQRPLIVYHAQNYQYGIWILNVLLNQDFKKSREQTRVGIESPTNNIKSKIDIKTIWKVIPIGLCSVEKQP